MIARHSMVASDSVTIDSIVILIESTCTIGYSAAEGTEQHAFILHAGDWIHVSQILPSS